MVKVYVFSLFISSFVARSDFWRRRADIQNSIGSREGALRRKEPGWDRSAASTGFRSFYATVIVGQAFFPEHRALSVSY